MSNEIRKLSANLGDARFALEFSACMRSELVACGQPITEVVHARTILKAEVDDLCERIVAIASRDTLLAIVSAPVVFLARKLSALKNLIIGRHATLKG